METIEIILKANLDNQPKNYRGLMFQINNYKEIYNLNIIFGEKWNDENIIKQKIKINGEKNNINVFLNKIKFYIE